MGRGDKRTKRGKIFRGSFGKSRPQNPATVTHEKKVVVKAETPATPKQ